MEKLRLSAAIKSIWDRCLDLSSPVSPFATYEWATTYFRTVGNKETPVILYHPTLSILAAFSQMNNTVQFAGGTEISDYMDLIGPDENKDQAWAEILPLLQQERIDQIQLHNLPESSATLKFFRKQNTLITPEDTTPKLVLPDAYSTYIESLDRKNRHELERKQRKFIRENPATKVQVSENSREDMEVLLKLMRLDERKNTFLTPEYEAFFRSLPESFGSSLILPILSVNTEPAAAVLAFITDKTFYLYNSGFDLQRFPGASLYLKAETIRLAIGRGCIEYNFLQGNERYKYELGGKDFGVFSVDYSIV